jgi:hypothetical protein
MRRFIDLLLIANRTVEPIDVALSQLIHQEDQSDAVAAI